MMKKGLVVGGIIILFWGLIIAVAPLLFKEKIKETLIHEVNTHLNARVEADYLRVSLFAGFPGVTIYLKDLLLIGSDTLRNDTIVQVGAAKVSLSLWKLTNGKYDLSNVELDRVKISARRLSDGTANWDVIKTDTLTSLGPPLYLRFRKMMLHRCDVLYTDEASDIQLQGIDWNGWLKADFTSGKAVLETKSTLKELTYSIRKIPYLKKIKVVADASVDVDFINSKLTFRKSLLELNHVKLGVDGVVSVLEKGRVNYDLSFLGADITFKDILSLRPALYAGIYQEIVSSGSVSFQGEIKGIRERRRRKYPSFRFHLGIDKAMFQYLSPKYAIKDIGVDATLYSTNGLFDGTVLDIKKLNFTAGDRNFRAHLEVRNPVSNLQLNGQVEGSLDLGLLNELHLWGEGVKLNGFIHTNLELETLLPDTARQQISEIGLYGYMHLDSISIKSGKYIDAKVEKARLTFEQRYTELSLQNARMKSSHFSVNGSVENLLGYGVNGEKVKADLEIKSDYLNPRDFSMGNKEDAPFVVPSNVDLSVKATAGKLVYGSLEMINVTGNFSMKNQAIKVNRFSAAMLGGNCLISGSYTTSNPLYPMLNLVLNLNKVSFASTVKSLELAQLYTPVFTCVLGYYSLHFNFSMAVKRRTKDSLAGLSGIGWLRMDEVKVKGVGSLTKLSSLLNIHLFNSFTTKNIYITFSVKDSQITTQPFDVKINHVKMNLGGTTGFDQSINYQGTLFFPPYMLVGFVSNVGFKIKGDFGNPQVSLVPVSALKNTSSKVVSDIRKVADFGASQTKKLFKKKK